MSLPMPASSEPWPGKQKATFVTAPPSWPAVCGSVVPPHELPSPGEPGAHTGHEHERPVAQPPVGPRIHERERNRAGRGVSVAVYVHDDLLRRDAELSGRVVDDPPVRLMRDVDVDVVHGPAALRQEDRKSVV